MFEAYDSKKRRFMAFATFAGFSITDAAWISIGTMAVDVLLRWEEEKQKPFPVLKTIDMLNYDSEQCLLYRRE